MSFDDPFLDTLDLDAEPGIIFQDLGEEVAGTVVFPGDRFTPSVIEGFGKAFSILLDAFISSPTACIHEIMMKW